MAFSLKPADPSQAESIRDLVNMAYRGEQGWTRETDIVAGDRSTLAEVESIFSNPNACLLVAHDEAGLAASVCVERKDACAYFGMFAVRPDLQNRGAGKAVLAQAEAFAAEEFSVSKFVMAVVSQRPELIAYYERRGYRKTGRIEPYPTHLDVGVPKAVGLTMEYLEKPARRQL